MQNPNYQPWDDPSNTGSYTGTVFPGGGPNPNDYDDRYYYEIAKGAEAAQRDWLAYDAAQAGVMDRDSQESASQDGDQDLASPDSDHDYWEDEKAALVAYYARHGGSDKIPSAEKICAGAALRIARLLSIHRTLLIQESRSDTTDAELVVMRADPDFRRDPQYPYLLGAYKQKSEPAWTLPEMIRPTWLLTSGDIVQLGWVRPSGFEPRKLDMLGSIIPLIAAGIERLHNRVETQIRDNAISDGAQRFSQYLAEYHALQVELAILYVDLP